MKSLTCTALVVCVAVAAPDAHASFPGRNGVIAATDPFANVRHIVAIRPGRPGVTSLTEHRSGTRRPRVTFGPQWSPDGRRLLFVEQGDDHAWTLWSADRGGGDERRLSGRST